MKSKGSNRSIGVGAPGGAIKAGRSLTSVVRARGRLAIARQVGNRQFHALPLLRGLQARLLLF